MTTRFYWQIHRLSFFLEKKADESLKEQLGVGFAQYKVLEAINQNALARQNMVANMLDQTEASISRQIKILQAKGLISVSLVMGNKRARELSLTRVGEEIVGSASNVLDVMQSQIMDGFSYQDQMILQELLDRMLDNARKSQT
jgi:DNA-binding MarR family transcriptional regulator